MRIPLTVIVVGLIAVGATSASAQQFTTGSPFSRTSSGFFENIGVGFNFNIRGGAPPANGNRPANSTVVGLTPSGAFTPNGDIQFRQGSAGLATPGVGGFTPGAGTTVGFGAFGGGGSAMFQIGAGQGSTRGLNSQSASVTTGVGGFGFISDTVQRPFVIGVVPVVGSGGGAGVLGANAGAVPVVAGIPHVPQPIVPGGLNAAPLEERLARLQAMGEMPGKPSAKASDREARELRKAKPQDEFALKLHTARSSSAGQGAASVAEIRLEQQRTADEASEAVQTLVANAERLEAEGKPGAARIYYQMAARRASGELKKEILDRAARLNER